MKKTISIFIAALVVGCGNNHPTPSKISAAAAADWKNGVDVLALFEAVEACGKQPSAEGCSAVKKKAKAIADAVASCQGNTSSLCESVNATQSFRAFGIGAATTLPQHPFYRSLGNELLDAQASNLGYRAEMFGRFKESVRAWFARWQYLFWTLGLLAVGQFVRTFVKNIKLREEEALLEHARLKKNLEEARREFERNEEQAREKAALEAEAERFTKKLEAEEAMRLVEEEQEAESLKKMEAEKKKEDSKKMMKSAFGQRAKFF